MRLIIDTDGGVDDAHALMMALACPGVTVDCITTVVGNVDLAQVDLNVGTTLDVMDMDVPFYTGADLPLVAPWKFETEFVHGADGLGDLQQRPVSVHKPAAGHAVTQILERSAAAPGEITLVAIGPRTNIALAVRLDPELPQRIKQLVVMGGSLNAVGNTDSLPAEFNIYCDPEAAHIVFDAFPNILLVTWEATLAHPLPWPVYKELTSQGGPRAAFYRDSCEGMLKRLRGVGLGDELLIPDTLTLAVTLCPELKLASERYHVAVELHGSRTRGQTVADHRRYAGVEARVETATQVDMAGVAALFRQMVEEA